jgi:hypothetical protein
MSKYIDEIMRVRKENKSKALDALLHSEITSITVQDIEDEHGGHDLIVIILESGEVVYIKSQDSEGYSSWIEFEVKERYE